MDFSLENLKKLLGPMSRPKGRRPVAKLTAEEIVRFVELNARTEAMKRDLMRVESKILADRNRLWADLSDKYGFHGRDVFYENSDGTLYEAVTEK